MPAVPRTPKRIGVAADHEGNDLEEHLARMLREAGYEVSDFGGGQPKVDDDYPVFVVPLVRAMACGEVDRGVAICGSGVGACVARHYVLVDDKLRILTAAKKVWGSRLTTVFPRQGHYANDPKTLATYPPADIAIERIGDLLRYDMHSLLPAGLAGSIDAASESTVGEKS